MKKTKYLHRIITKVNTRYGAPMGRPNWNGSIACLTAKRMFDVRVPMCKCCGAYDIGGAYWGTGKELRVKFTDDLSYIEFYRKEDSIPVTVEKTFQGALRLSTITGDQQHLVRQYIGYTKSEAVRAFRNLVKSKAY